MRFRFFCTIVFVSLLATTACKTPKAAQANPEQISDLTCRPIHTDKEVMTDHAPDIVNMDSLWIEGDCLHLLTPRLQCCDVTQFQLGWNGAMMKSSPPQANLLLYMPQQTACKEMHSFHLTFELRFLRYGLPGVPSTTQLRVKGWKRPVEYMYTK